MRRRRLKIKGDRAIYHWVSRTVNRERLMDGMAKEVLRGQIWQVAEFSGVEVLTYCVMSNHFHVLVKVPDRESVKVTDKELMDRYRVLYPRPTQYQPMRAEVLERQLEEGGDEAEKIRKQLLARMHDISEFMKTLKQRFTIWYNHTYGRVGTIWSERFKSTLVEGKETCLSIVAAYIDLNPVRAGLAKDPKDYRWSGYGEAVGGSVEARKGILELLRHGDEELNWKRGASQYRMLLYCKGAAPPAGREKEGAIIPQEEWKREMERGGELPVAAALRCRVRYFTDGAVLGSKDFVDEIFGEFREEFGQRRGGARKMKGSDWAGLTVVRDLRGNVFG